MNLTIKRCTKCNEEKDVSCFSKDKNVKSGFYSRCRACCSLENKSKTKEQRELENNRSREKRKERAKNPDKVEAVKRQKHEYYLKNKQKIIEYAKKRTYSNYSKHLESARKYAAKNKHKRALYLSKNSEKARELKRKREYTRYNSDLNFKIRKSIRARVNKAMRNGGKYVGLSKYLGCTIEELKAYLESKFQPGMTWGNWSVNGWHIDHIMPLAAFDLTDPEQLKKACHYTNLQPLWAKDNLSKADKLPDQLTGPNHG